MCSQITDVHLDSEFSVKENDHLAEQSRFEAGQKESEAPDKKMCFEKSLGCRKNIPSPGPGPFD